MTVYIDPADFLKPRGKKRYSHLTADTLAEMHAFAARIGLGRHFFHSGARHVHYDLPEDRRSAALAAGAREVSAREMVALSKAIHPSAKGPARKASPV